MIISTEKNQKELAEIFIFDDISKIEEKFQKLIKKSEENKIIFLHQDNQFLVFNLKKEENISKKYENLRVLASNLLQELKNEDIFEAKLTSTLNKKENLAFLEGLLLSSYSFDKYKTEKTENQEFKIYLEEKMLLNISEEEILELQNLIKSVEITRNLVNEPVSYLTTQQFSEEIKKLGQEFGFSVEILSKKEIEELKMGGLLGVNLGSENPPAFNILSWKPDNYINEKPIILVGKGVVYDTGGYNIKFGNFMDTMKSDMAGGASVVGLFCAVSKNKLPLHIVGLIPSTDNRINSKAMVSDDILIMSNGLSVEVKNTDAEGRLILADALVYAQKYAPELVIDLATLTGAAARITGIYGSAIMGTADNQEFNDLKQAGDLVYERLVELPFWDEFSEDLKSPIADLKNMGNPEGGASVAGKFLQKFTDYPWIHIDIAGSAFLTRSYKYFKAGATGVGVRLLYHFLKQKAKLKEQF